MAKLASSKRTRSYDSSDERPCRWRPRSVIDPRTGEPFTADSAWERIVELLNSGYAIEEMVLDIPPGRKGYVMKVQGAPGQNDLYIKLQLLSGTVHARSFHESEYPSERRTK